jgi:hypothetical protein
VAATEIAATVRTSTLGTGINPKGSPLPSRRVAHRRPTIINSNNLNMQVAITKRAHLMHLDLTIEMCRKTTSGSRWARPTVVRSQ